MKKITFFFKFKNISLFWNTFKYIYTPITAVNYSQKTLEVSVILGTHSFRASHINLAYCKYIIISNKRAFLGAQISQKV